VDAGHRLLGNAAARRDDRVPVPRAGGRVPFTGREFVIMAGECFLDLNPIAVFETDGIADLIYQSTPV
jgi:hypothetical protein